MDRVPFTEQFEVVKSDWVKDDTTDTANEKLYKAHINYAYATLLPMMVDEQHLRKEAFVTTKADYSTGTIDISASGTTITAGDEAPAWTVANSDDFLFKAGGKNTVARVTRTDANTLTFKDSLAWPEAAVDEGSYLLVLDRYALASDFNRMMTDNVQFPRVVHWWTNGSKQFLTPRPIGEFERKFYHIHSTPTEYTVKKDFASNSYYLYINPPDTLKRILNYAYIPKLTFMTEYTTGTVTTTSDSTVVTGASTDFDGKIDTSLYDYYFRLDDDGVGGASEWYLIASVSGDTGMVLDSAYVGANAGSGKNYTVSMVSKYPPGLDRALMLMAAALSDPDVTAKKEWINLYVQHVAGFSTMDVKRIYGLTWNTNFERK